MRPVSTFAIRPALPERIKRLRDLAFNLWWCWEHEAIDLIRRLDVDLWDDREVYHNPVKMLNMVPQKRLQELAEDEGFLAQYDRVIKWLDTYVEGDAKGTTWYRRTFTDAKDWTFAYFSAEFGINECIPIYSGGLGLLAGDHLKSASDLGIPLVAVGLLYQQGYFRQYLNNDGWQQEEYPINDFYSMPLDRVFDRAGNALYVDVEYPGRTVRAQIWKVQVGRVPLYLLDANLDENSPPDRDITDQLYGGDLEMRIKQEILLGIGGARALEKLGIRPTVFHMNEGHSAFLALERIRRAMEECKCSFWEAVEIVRSGTVFTTHTPVPAGNDRFQPETIERYLSSYYRAFGISRDQFLALGQEERGKPQGLFCMTVLAMNLAAYSNGVSKLHGRVARDMWKHLWPGLPVDEVPIISITNGVHVRSWISNDMAWLYNRYLGPRWMERPGDETVWKSVARIPDEELWRTHERRRERLVAFARRRLEAQLKKRGATRREVTAASQVLDPDALTIGFARRFATYKRATLLFRDADRLIRLLTDKNRPVQLIFAGKAHPQDNPGKELIREVVHFIRRTGVPKAEVQLQIAPFVGLLGQDAFRQLLREEFGLTRSVFNGDLRSRIVFIEDYDINVARYLVQGVDVWLNTPRRPLEASGTSGMKAAMNGALNLSVLDGWWDEAYNALLDIDIGWAIGQGEQYGDSESEYQDDVESRALFNILENEVIPLFYERDNHLPRGWIARMKASMENLCPEFNTNRMVREYTELHYKRATERWLAFKQDKYVRAKELAAWKERVRKAWKDVRFGKIKSDRVMEPSVGSNLQVKVSVYLGSLKPGDVSVEIYHGKINSEGDIVDGRAVPMTYVEGEDDGHTYGFVGDVPALGSGQHGFAVRVMPRHAAFINPHEMGLMVWSS